MPRTLIGPSGFDTRILDAVGDVARFGTRAIDLAAYAADASHYLFTPRGVLVADDEYEVARVLRAATAASQPVTFRSGGTSLSGQASTDELLIDTRRNFRRVDVLDGGSRVRVQPGATVRQVNARLLRHGYRLGPDPASEAACTIGGVVANNSSGMTCGISENTYETLESMVMVLPSGTRIDTASADADVQLGAREPALYEGLLRLRERVRGSSESLRIIRERFAMKNTIGYGINALVDFDSPVQMLAHLIIGSEGTLAFVAEATFRTVPVQPRIATALAVFPTLADATSVLPDLVATGAATVELMDSTSLRVGQAMHDAPAQIRDIELDRHAALLIEYHADDDAPLAARTERGTGLLAVLPLVAGGAFSTDATPRAHAWKLRKGLYASVAGARPAGTTALLEDIVVPVPHLATACTDLQQLFGLHGYEEGVIFGHAKDGNIHFMLTDRFGVGEATDRLRAFTDDLVDLVLLAGGNLKAEHGTGRAMAPFVRRQYGDELYAVMVELKQLCDPAGILNPGVIITTNADAHVSNIKLIEPIEAEVDRCVECGYCEPVCPSKDLTLTPRQRIVTRRAMARAEASGDTRLVEQLTRDYDYSGAQTCAVDGMCQTVCPLGIDTGKLVKRLRRESATWLAEAGWSAAATAWGPVSRAAAAALSATALLPAQLPQTVTTVGRALLGPDSVPAYSADIPGGGRGRRRLEGTQGAKNGEIHALYLPACINSMFGAAGEGIGVTDAFVALCDRAGIRLVVPRGIEALCCSTPWTSKGFTKGRDTMRRRLRGTIGGVTNGEALRVVSDASSCTEGFAQLLVDAGLPHEVEDAVAFTAREVLPRLEVARTFTTPMIDSLVLHPTCSSRQSGLDDDLRRIAESVAASVTVPDAWNCCGFAGDRGMLHPELTAAATAPEAAEVVALDGDAHASCNRTCEMALSRATGHEYRHILELLEEATR